MPTPSKVDLVCVDPARVRELWPYAGPLIRAATRRLTLFEQIERSVLVGDQLLWIIWNGKQITAAATTHLSDGACTITACGGSSMKSWLPAFSQIQQYAKDEGCSVRIQGREGWKRALKRSGIRVESILFVERAA